MEQNELTVIIYYKKTFNSCYVDFTEKENIMNKRFLRFRYAAIKRYSAKYWAAGDGYIEFNPNYVVPCSQDEKQIFFDALAKIGKQWNAENKCIEDIKSKFYFKPKDWCLMSCGGYNEWVLCQFSNIKDLGYIAVGGKYFTQCIPYNDKTKHLLGTIYDATEKYKVW